MRRLMLVLVAAALATEAGCRRVEASRAAQGAVDRVIGVLEAQNPNPVSVAPGGDRLLVKSMHATDFELAIVELASGKVTGRLRSPDTQLAPTFSPDGRALAFLADRHGDQQYRVHLWDLASGEARECGLPPTTATALRWSPDGRRVAYLQGRRGTSARKLLVAEPCGSSPALEVLDELSPKAGFIWAPDSDRLAAVSLSDEGAITIASVAAGLRHRLAVTPGGEVRGLAWSEDGERLLATARAPGRPYFDLYRVSVAGGRAARILERTGDLSGPLFAQGDRVAVHENVDGDVTALLCDGAACRELGPPGGLAAITGFSKGLDSAFVLNTGRVTAPALYSVPLDGTPATLLQSATTATAATEGRRVGLPTDGTEVPAYFWEAAPTGLPPAAIVRVHGGPDAQSFRAWDAGVQLLVARGYHVLSVNYRGSTGYGARFEQLGGHAQRVDDVVAAARWLTRTLGVPPERIILVGHSYGAQLVADAACSAPDAIGAVALLSLTGSPPARCSASTRSLRWVAFHGAQDSVVQTPGIRAHLDSIFGSGAADRLMTFDSEGHVYHRLDSWGRVYAEIAGLVGP
jgi:dipeptidyl aminopeptidase/acylaminoacyl peptidase